jgi:hypothetical protein
MIGSEKAGRWAALVMCSVIAATALLAPSPDTSLRSALAIHDFGHVVAFGLVTALFAFALHVRARPTFRRRAAAICFSAGASLSLGTIVELIQAFTGGKGDPWDVWRDGGGAFSVAILLIALDPAISARVRAALACLAVLALVTFALPVIAALGDEARARMQFPVLASFETTEELTRFHFSLVSFQTAEGFSRFHFEKGNFPPIVSIRDIDGSTVSAARLHLPPGRYASPGLALRYFPRDWRGMGVLRLLIVNPESSPITMTVRLEDAEYDYRLGLEDRYDRSLALAPGANRIEIPLSDVAAAPRSRQFDLGRVQSLLVFAADLKQARDIIIGPIVLLR